MRMGPSLLRRRSPATALEVKTVHEESRDRGVGGGVFSTVKGICRTWGCFFFLLLLLVPSEFWKTRGQNSNLRVTPFLGLKFILSLKFIHCETNRQYKKKEKKAKN